MEKLSKDWLTQGLIDFEYKKYVLLAYLKTVKQSFGKVELYPFLADLVLHYRNLTAVKENKALFRESFPKELSLEEIARSVDAEGGTVKARLHRARENLRRILAPLSPTGKRSINPTWNR